MTENSQPGRLKVRLEGQVGRALGSLGVGIPRAATHRSLSPPLASSTSLPLLSLLVILPHYPGPFPLASLALRRDLPL